MLPMEYLVNLDSLRAYEMQLSPLESVPIHDTKNLGSIDPPL